MKTARRLFMAMAGCFALTLSSCVDEKPVDDYSPYNVLEKGDAIPHFAIDSNEGVEFDSDSFTASGVKRSLVVLFTSGCPTCRKLMPNIDKVWKHVQDNGDANRFNIVAVLRGETGLETSEKNVRELWESNDMSMPYYPDPDRAVYDLFATLYVPRIYIVDSRGKIEWMSVENGNFSASSLAQRLYK